MKKTTPEKKIKTTKEVTYENVVLEGVEAIRAEKHTTIFEVTHEPISKNKYGKNMSKKEVQHEVESVVFPLIEVTPQQLIDFREKKVASFVLKINEKLYHAAIPDNIYFVADVILGAHKCATVGKECGRLSAASDEEGGCAKVRNSANYIERYSWITRGYETFNTNHDSFVVVECLQYEKCAPRRVYTAAEMNKARLNLAQYVLGDVKNLEQVIDQKDSNKYRIIHH